MKDFLGNFPFREFSIFIIILCSFTYNVLLDRDVACACKDVDLDCWVYLLCPVCIIFCLILCIDKKMRKVCQYSCACTRTCSGEGCRMHLFGVLLSRIFKAIFVGLLWIVSVLIDGDWYVCCKVGRSEQQAKIACKDKTNITTEEKEIITEVKNASRSYGFFLLLGIILLVALMLACDWRRCCNIRGTVFDMVILTEQGKVLKNILKEAGEEDLRRIILNKIDGNKEKWNDCNVVAEILKQIENSENPTLSIEQRKKLNELEAEKKRLSRIRRRRTF